MWYHNVMKLSGNSFEIEGYKLDNALQRDVRIIGIPWVSIPSCAGSVSLLPIISYPLSLPRSTITTSSLFLIINYEVPIIFLSMMVIAYEAFLAYVAIIMLM